MGSQYEARWPHIMDDHGANANVQAVEGDGTKSTRKEEQDKDPTTEVGSQTATNLSRAYGGATNECKATSKTKLTTR
jgi:hypothetical protein